MRRLLVLSVVVLVAGGLVSLAAGSGSSPAGRWVVRDLGAGYAALVNNRGQVVGIEKRSTYPVARGFLWEDGRVRARWSLGTYKLEVTALNDRGEVVGHGWLKEKTVDGFHLTHVYVWRNGVLLDLTPGRDRESEDPDINDRGEIIGSMFESGQGWSAFRWSGGRLETLSPPPALKPPTGRVDVRAYAINESGQIVGTLETEDRDRQVLLWQMGEARALKQSCVPVAINKAGTILCSTQGRAYVFGGGRWIRIPGTVTGNALNDRGQVVGQRRIHHAFLWQDGEVIDLTPNVKGSTGTALNNRGQVVINAKRKAPADSLELEVNRAYVWEAGRATPLPPLRPGDSTRANAINDRGEIVGWSGDHAVLWTKTG